MSLNEIQWIVGDLLPTGCFFLCGKPKHGKSILALNLAISISSGTKVLGKFSEITHGVVLYLALEDNLRRLQKRLRQMFTYGGEPSNDLKFITTFPRMDQGGLEKLEMEIRKYSNTRLVIIDTLARFRPPRPRNADPYQWDYDNSSALKAVADKFNIALLTVHHLRKASAEDPFDSVSGTLGLTGSADGTLLLIRKTGQADAELHITGRDVEAAEYALKFDPAILTWNVLGGVEEIKSTAMKQRLFDAIKDYGAEFSPRQIAKASDLSESYVNRMIPYLIQEGNVKKLERGKYALS